MAPNEGYVPFSQRNGFAPIPPQLELGEVSQEHRALLNYAWDREVERRKHKKSPSIVDGGMAALAKDLAVKFMGIRPLEFKKDTPYIKIWFEQYVSRKDIGQVFDLIEFILRHECAGNTVKDELACTFSEARSAYRVIDNTIVPIGNEQQGAAVKRAFDDVDVAGATASKQHLLASGVELRNGNWADSVRESIHAVEAMARKIDPSAQTLGRALKTLGNSVHLHGSLKDGFSKLYGYTNDENGIRHALSEASSPVDEVDSLFMYGACASFVSYLIARERER